MSVTAARSTVDAARDRLVGLVPARLAARWDSARHAPLVVLALGFAIEIPLAFWLVRDEWFGADALHYLTRRGTVPGESLGFFEPWGGHWQTVPIVLYRVMFAIVGLRSYLPYVGMVIVIHVLLCLLLYALLVRAGASRWAAVAAAWGLLFFGGGSEAFLFDGPLPIILAVLLGLSAWYVGQRRGFDRRGWIGMVVLLVLAVMTSGAGILATAVVSLLVLLEQGWRSVLRLAGPPAALFILWFLIWGRGGDRARLGGWSAFDVPKYVWNGLDTTFGSVIGVDSFGAPFVLAVMMAPFVITGTAPALRRLAFAGVALSIGQLFLVALSSMYFGFGTSEAPRYQYVVLLGLLPAAVVLAEGLARRVGGLTKDARAVAGVAAFLLVLGATGNGIAQQHSQTDFLTGVSRVQKDLIYGVVAAVDAGERPLTHKLDSAPLASPDDFSLVARPELRKTLPERKTDPKERLGAEGLLFVGVSSKTFDLTAPATVRSTSFDPFVGGGGCAEYEASSFTPSIEIPTGEGVQVVVTYGGSKVTTTLSRGGLTDDPHEWTIDPGKPNVIGTTAKDATLLITFDFGGTYTICA